MSWDFFEPRAQVAICYTQHCKLDRYCYCCGRKSYTTYRVAVKELELNYKVMGM